MRTEGNGLVEGSVLSYPLINIFPEFLSILAIPELTSGQGFQ